MPKGCLKVYAVRFVEPPPVGTAIELPDGQAYRVVRHQPGFAPTVWRTRCLETGIEFEFATGLLALAGCATTTADCTNLAQGVCKISGTRFLTDSAITLDATGQDGQPLHLGFTSQPNQAGVSAAFAQLGSVIGLLGKLVAAQAVPGQPAPPPVVVPPFPKPPATPERHEP
jgi:hypothetical protein